MLFFSKNDSGKPGVRDLVNRWTTSLLTNFHLRARLATLEIQEFLDYWKIVALLIGIGAAAAFTAFLLVNALILVLFQDHLVAATAIMLGIYVLLTAGVILAIFAMKKNAPSLLGDTLEEVRKDVQMLSEGHDHE